MMLLKLEESEICEDIVFQTINTFVEELQISEFEYVQFNQSIKDPILQRAYFEIRTELNLK